MKKILNMIVIFLLVFSLTACDAITQFNEGQQATCV